MLYTDSGSPVICPECRAFVLSAPVGACLFTCKCGFKKHVDTVPNAQETYRYEQTR